MKTKQIIYMLLVALFILNAGCSKQEPTAEQKAEERQAKQDATDKKLNDTSSLSKPSSGRHW